MIFHRLHSELRVFSLSPINPGGVTLSVQVCLHTCTLHVNPDDGVRSFLWLSYICDQIACSLLQRKFFPWDLLGLDLGIFFFFWISFTGTNHSWMSHCGEMVQSLRGIKGVIILLQLPEHCSWIHAALWEAFQLAKCVIRAAQLSFSGIQQRRYDMFYLVLMIRAGLIWMRLVLKGFFSQVRGSV